MNIDKNKLKIELIKFAQFCKKNGGTSWHDIPESGIDSYLNQANMNENKYLEVVFDQANQTTELNNLSMEGWKLIIVTPLIMASKYKYIFERERI